jgi:hypothetical protein
VRTVSGSLLQTCLAKRLTLVAPGKDSTAPLSGRIHSHYSEIETNLQQKNTPDEPVWSNEEVVSEIRAGD